MNNSISRKILNRDRKMINIAPSSEVSQDNLSRWRGNNYVNEDGILPFQLCHANDFYPGSKRLFPKFVHDGKEYQMIITAATVFGRTNKFGEPIYVKKIDFLAFFQESENECDYQKFQCLVSRLRRRPRTSCIFGNHLTLPGATYRVKKNQFVEFPTKLGSAAVAVVECKIEKHIEEIREIFEDHFEIKLIIGDNNETATADICYQHVTKPKTLHICTTPQFGYENENDTFWYGSPRYSGYNNLDAFLIYHTKIMDASVTINDLWGSETLMKLMRPYRALQNKSENEIRFRSNWRHPKEFPKNNKGVYLFENICQTTCIWESRLSAHWTMLLQAVDNFAYPISFNNTITDILKVVKKDDLIYAKVPIILPGTDASHAKTGNILTRFNLLSRLLWYEFLEERYTPLGNPRKISYSWVHTMAIYDRFCTIPENCWGKVYGPMSAVKILGLATVHIMGITREEYNRKDGMRDPWYLELGNRLENALLAFLKTEDQSRIINNTGLR